MITVYPLLAALQARRAWWLMLTGLFVFGHRNLMLWTGQGGTSPAYMQVAWLLAVPVLMIAKKGLPALDSRVSVGREPEPINSCRPPRRNQRSQKSDGHETDDRADGGQSIGWLQAKKQPLGGRQNGVSTPIHPAGLLHDVTSPLDESTFLTTHQTRHCRPG